MFKALIKKHNTNHYLEDLSNVPICGGFYVEEILPANFPDMYVVENVLKRHNGWSDDAASQETLKTPYVTSVDRPPSSLSRTHNAIPSGSNPAIVQEKVYAASRPCYRTKERLESPRGLTAEVFEDGEGKNVEVLFLISIANRRSSSAEAFLYRFQSTERALKSKFPLLAIGPIIRERMFPATLLPPRRTGFDPRRGNSRILACGCRAGRCRRSRGTPVSSRPFIPALIHSSTLIGSQDLAVKSHRNLFTHYCFPQNRTEQNIVKWHQYPAEGP
ncbi:hypothetical protein PR048_023894 [Dryococelus australis]|uniref:Uncharacterized protein n=1 Tax=Dryococelus australis TaxID=614101 RepID=A0ABQ9GVA7_9NEOP|nr:hypothetical protein PR048_023894 [Dryococelus australis]